MAVTNPVVIDISEASESAGLVFASNFVLIVLALVALSVEAGDALLDPAYDGGDQPWWDRFVAGPVIVGLMGVYLWLAATMDYSARYWRRHAFAGAVFAAVLIGGILAAFIAVFEWSWTFLVVAAIVLALFAPLVMAALGLLGASMAALEARLGPHQTRLVDMLDDAARLREPLSARRRRAPPTIPFLGRFLTVLGLLGIAGLAAAFIVVGVFETRNPALSDTAAGIGGVLLFALPVSGLLLILGGRLAQPSANRLLATDGRAPILLLRSFADDPAKVRSRNVLRQFLFYGLDRGMRLEAAIADELSALGPLVAVGQPGERLPPLGAARGYFADDEWQPAVLGLMTRARLVALIAGRTEGVIWELRQLAMGGHLEKTVLLFPPDTPDGKAARWRVLAQCLAEVGMAVDLQPDALPNLLAIYFAEAAPTAILSKTSGQVDYELIVRVTISAIARGEAAPVRGRAHPGGQAG